VKRWSNYTERRGKAGIMNPHIEVIAKKVNEQLAIGESLLEDLQTFGWKDERPDREDEYVEDYMTVDRILADRGEYLGVIRK
jgi:hypothetical protein